MSLFNRHVHQWQDVSFTYTQPVATRAWSTTDHTLKMLVFGITNILQRCAICNKATVETVPGRVERR